MAIIAKKSAFEAAPEGSHRAVCYGIVDLGVQENNFEGKVSQSQKVRILWELVDETLEINDEVVRRTISNDYTLSLSDKSNLTKDLTSWFGRKLTADELDGFDLSCVLNKNCLVQIVHTEKGYANIAAVISLPKGMGVEVPENELICFDLDDTPENIQSNLELLPEWIQNKVKASLTYIDIFGVEPQQKLAKREVQRDANPKKSVSRLPERAITRPTAVTASTDVF